MKNIIITLKSPETDIILDGIFSKEMADIIKKDIKEFQPGEFGIRGELYEDNEQEKPFASYSIYI